MKFSFFRLNASNDDSEYRPREAYSVLVVLIFVTITLNLAILPFGQVADPVRKAFGIDDIQFSLLLGALFAVPSMVMSVFGGWLADRLARSRLLVAAMAGWTIGALLCAFASSYQELAIGRLIVAASAGVKFPLAMTWISDAFPGERRGRAISAFFVILGIAPAIGASLSGAVLGAAESGALVHIPVIGSMEPWRVALALLALTSVLPMPFVAMLRDSRPRAASSDVDTSSGAGKFPVIPALAMVAVSALLSMADTANLAWLPTVLRRQHAFDAQQVGYAFALITTVGGSVGPIGAGVLDGWIYRHYGNPGRLVACGIASLICAPLLLAFAGGNAQVLVGSLVVSGAISMAAGTFGYTAIQSLLPSSKRGLGTGMANAVNNLAQAAAPTMVAFVAGRLALGAASLGTGVAVVTVSAFLLIALLCFSTAKRAGPRSRAVATSEAGSRAAA